MKQRYLSLLLYTISAFTLSAQVPSYIPTNGLVGWWPFNGNANDESGNGNNGTVNGATLTTDRFGVANKAYSFDASTSHIYVPFSTSMNSIQSGITMSAWILMDGGTPSGYPPRIMELRGAYGGGGDAGFVLLSNGNSNIERSFEVRLYNNSGNTNVSINPTNNVPSLTWHYVVFTADGNNASGKFYVDGNLVNTNSNQLYQGLITACNFNNNPLYIGSEPNILGKWGGKLDDIGIWNRALTQSEITALYTTTTPPTPPTLAVSPASTTICGGSSTTLSATTNAGSSVCVASQLPTVLQSGLVGYWPFCGNADDASGNGNNGTVNGATLTNDRFGNASSAYSFDGVNDYIVVQDIPILKPSNSISLCAWVNIDMSEQSNFNSIIYKSHNQSQNYSSYSLITGNAGWNQTGNPGFTLRTTSSYNWTGANGTSTQVPGQNITNQWQFVCGTWDGTNMKIYQNGVLIATVPQSGTIIYNTENLFFGKRKDGGGLDDFFTGKLDDIAIWNRALTASEIQQLYTLGNSTYSWSPGGATTSSITVSPTSTTTYTCTATANGVSSIATSVITVLPAPTVNAGVDLAVCTGSTATLTATGAATYSWTNSVQNGVAFTPSATTTYTVTGTDANGCTGTDAVTVTLVPSPTITATNTTVCAGQSTTLTASAPGSWSPGGATTPSITVSPTSTTTYTCTVTDANGNSCSASQTITVIPFSSVNAGADQTICAGGTATLTATGATSYSWNNLVQNGVAFSPVSSSSYIVTGTQNGCTDSDTVLVTVVADPTITNPVAASYCQNGGTVTPLSVGISGGIGAAYAYQWYANTSVNNFGGTPILGATTATYTPPINNIGTVFYYCAVTQGAATNGCLATSGANSIVVNAQPTITSQPLASQSGCVGATLTPLSLAISGGNGTPTYQWYANTTASTSGGSIITGATSSSYVPSNTTAGTYYFYCVASYPNATSCATKTSNLATITFINDPIFSVPPTANQSVCVGGSIPALTFISSGGSGTPSYQWYAVNGSTYTTILGATNPSYTPPTFSIAGTYAYAVAISQTTAGCASGFSPLANVTVVADPNVSSPSAANYCQGGAVSNPLSVTATGGINSGYSYQWFSNGSNNNTSGVAITGATAATYAPPTAAIGNLFYYCLVSQGSGCATSSAPAGINIVPGPALISQPLAAQSVCVGSTLNAFNVAYSGGTGTPSYQWFSATTNTNSNGTPIAGATNASYTPGANAVGQVYYYCVISFSALTSCSSISSTPGQVNVIANPVFSVAPLSSQTICQGANPQVLSFTTTGGSGTATYQWYNVVNNNYTPIIGANGLTYSPSTSLPAGSYNYAVAMTQNASGCSTGFSPNAQLVVLQQPVVSTPQGGVYCQGGTIGQPLSVSVTGGNGSSSYQWYQSTTNNNSGGTAINGATNSSFTPSLVNFGTLYYYCAVTQNAGCAANSAVATVVSNPSPVISAQPVANQTICIGSSPSPLSTSYTGGVGAPSYQWFMNNQNTTLGGTPIVGANSSAYIPSNQVGLGTNYYYCVVTLSNSSCPQAITNVAAVNTVSNPSVNGPLSSTYCQSTAVAQPLSVSASGGNGTSYSYQWYSNVNNTNFGGNPILGANNPNYTPNISGASNNFYCVVTQPGGCQTASAVATVEVVSTPNIASQPIIGQTLCVGGTPQALAITTAGGVSNPSYQWYSNTVNTITNASAIANANSASFTPNSVSTTGTTYYFCQVTFATNSACPTLVSNAATIIVASDPTVSNPTNSSYCQNATTIAPLTITASGGINVGYGYQWFSNTTNSNIGGTAIPGATNNNYFPAVNQIGTTYYYCEVTQGSGCNASSAAAAIAVGVAAAINNQPVSSQNLCLGQTASTLTIGVTAGNYALSYQWYSNVTNNNFGGSVIVGANNAFYTPPSNTLGTKYYYCVVTVAGGGCGNLTSNTAGITVLTAPSMFQPNNQTICCQSNTNPINFVGNANTYSWTASGSSPLLTGYTSAGNGNIPSLQLTNTSSTPQNVIYLVTPSNQGCNGTPVQFNISVMPCLSVSTPSDQYYCAQDNASAFVFSGVGSSYTWVNSNTTIGLQNAGVNFVPNFTTQNTTTTTQTATITVTPNFMGCAGTPQSYTITVYPLPIVAAGADQAVCAGGSVTLTASGAPSLTWDNGILNGQTFVPNASTTYTVTGTDANGCQNQDAVFVQVNQPTSATLNINACNSYTLNGQTYTQSGTYDQLLSNAAGCDSSLTLNLSLNFSPSQPNIYVQNQINLSTDLTPGLSYQWITCSDLTPIAGQTAITFNPSSNGVYAVVVTNSCGSDTSLCTSITTIGLEEWAKENMLLYPNPNNGNFTLEVPDALIGQKVYIYDMQGRLLDQLELTTKVNYIEFKHFARGAYWLQIENEVPLKWIKN